MSGKIQEIGALFLKLGLIAFGGPAAHIAMMEDEVVSRRKWISRDHFLDLVGATNLIPGPNSTEMTMHIGYERGGWAGLFVAGSLFILPAALLTGTMAWLYQTYGTLPEVAPFLNGIKPAVLGVILSALIKLGRKAVKGWLLAVLGLGVMTAVLFGADEVIALLIGGVVGMLALRFRTRLAGSDLALWPLLWRRETAVSLALTTGAGTAVSLWELGLFFLKIGSILYGSGYVLVAYLEGGLVNDLGWLTQAQLLDAIAIGQFTPGPVLTTATFVGFLVAGAPGAVVATLGIFLPSFLFVLILNPLIPKMRQSAWLSAFLDAVNVSAVALMTAVLIDLGRATLVDVPAVLIAVAASVLAIRYRVNSAWLILGGAVVGYGLGLLF